MRYHVYLMLGFHINFYHSWRGDTPDEAGFGTDMRVIRGVLGILDGANAAGQQARVYWDTEVYWTLQEILPQHCPDILERIQRRVEKGQDEIVLGPYNNGANHAATADEFRTAIHWAVENPWGSGLRQLFSKVTPFYRPQECVFTIGQEQILKECGVDGLVLYYALSPFNSLGVFTPGLPLERRFNPFWFRSREDQPRLIVFPAMSSVDVLEKGSLEGMMLDLHARQLRGEINSDVVIHLNEDADLETWLPLGLPWFARWLPNTGGLQEYIDIVNKYDWASFTVPSEYLAAHPPKGEVLVRQDLADGAFDGSYSWAEKHSSLRAWTLLEQSRLVSYRAEALANRAGLDLSGLLWEGRNSSFFKRLIGLSTTHFGMSTPVINEERQARAFTILGEALSKAHQAERQAAAKVVAKPPKTVLSKPEESNPSPKALYSFELFPTSPNRSAEPPAARMAVTLPLILPAGVTHIALSAQGKLIPASVTDWIALAQGGAACEIRFIADLDQMAGTVFTVEAAPSIPIPEHSGLLKNQWLAVEFSEESGIRSLRYHGVEVGGGDFLHPFVSYRLRKKATVFPVTRWEFLPLNEEQWQDCQRVRMRAHVPMRTREGEFDNQFTFTFTLFNSLPHLYVDVEARYAATPSTETINNLTQKLRRLMDLRWIEVAPCQLHPQLAATPQKPLRVWKHNFLDITSYFDLDYGRINPRNRNLDSFNHQVTAGWVAVSDGKRGLLLGENADQLASMAFCPMRLREVSGMQNIWLNPFGSYYGEQASYSHLGASGLGADFLKAFSGFMKPNAPSYNGQTVRFELMLAPYAGDEPPAVLQSQAAAFFYPPEIVFHTSPKEVQALLPADIHAAVDRATRKAALLAIESIPVPEAFLANPSSRQVDLVWNPPRDVPVTGYEIAWREAGLEDWRTVTILPADRWQILELQDGKEYVFKIRAICEKRLSDWTEDQRCVLGAVSGSQVSSGFALLPARALMRLLIGSLWSVMRSAFRK